MKMGNVFKSNNNLGNQVASETELLVSTQKKLEEDQNRMVYLIIISVVGAVVVGMILGSCIVMCCL